MVQGSHLCVITVYVVEDPGKRLLADVVQCDYRDAGLCLQLMTLTEVIL